MQNNNIHAPTTKQILADSRSMLLRKNTILKLIFGVFLLTAAFVVSGLFFEYIYLGICYFAEYDIYEKYYGVFGAASAVLRSFILSPLFLGLCRLSSILASGKNADFIEIFAYYGSFRAYLRSTVAVSVVFLPFLASIVALLLFPSLTVLKLIVLAVCLLWLFIIKTRLFTFLSAVVCGKDQSLFLCFKAAIISTRKRTAKLLLFSLGFIPWILLSIPTLGVLLLIFVLPYIFLAESRYSSYLLTGEYRNYISEETL